mmetsp:Transcript_8594/g.20080  ORF Transcript_8594/g.20080 Transcript_8594/m.20080 type:complete len:115 (-) Transcript_8594:218-562(-)
MACYHMSTELEHCLAAGQAAACASFFASQDAFPYFAQNDTLEHWGQCGDALGFLDASFDSGFPNFDATRPWAPDPSDSLLHQFGSLGLSPAQGGELAVQYSDGGCPGLQSLCCA